MRKGDEKRPTTGGADEKYFGKHLEKTTISFLLIRKVFSFAQLIHRKANNFDSRMFTADLFAFGMFEGCL